MIAKQMRFSDELDAKAKRYAESLGLSFNALVVVALAEYLEARNSAQVRAMEKPVEPRQVEEPPAIPAEDFKLTPSPPARMEAGKPIEIELSRAERRRLQRLGGKH